MSRRRTGNRGRAPRRALRPGAGADRLGRGASFAPVLGQGRRHRHSHDRGQSGTGAEVGNSMNRLALALALVAILALPMRADEPRRDRFGDPLPAGAIARLGTVQAHVGVEGIAFSADGKSLISWSRHAVRHWDATTGRITKLIERRLP